MESEKRYNETKGDISRLLPMKEEYHRTAKKRNILGREWAKKQFFRGVSQLKGVVLTDEAAKMLRIMEQKIVEKFDLFEKEIEQTVVTVKELGITATSKLWGKLICLESNMPARLYKEWNHEIPLENQLIFKDIAKLMKIKYEWTISCTCSKCRSLKKIYGDDRKKKRAKKTNKTNKT